MRININPKSKSWGIYQVKTDNGNAIAMARSQFDKFYPEDICLEKKLDEFKALQRMEYWSKKLGLPTYDYVEKG